MITGSENRTGFTLVEILIVLGVIGVLTSMAVPYYRTYTDRAKAAHCAANRRHIELDGAAYYLEYGASSLEIEARYRCPSDGTYLWVENPAKPEQPRIVCSIHGGGGPLFSGSADGELVPPGGSVDPVKPEKPKKPKKDKKDNPGLKLGQDEDFTPPGKSSP